MGLSKMKIAIVYQYYYEYSAPGHSLIYDLTQYLAQKGHQVTVIAGETGYMKPNIPKLPWYRRIIQREKYGNVSVIRTYTYPELHRSYLGRFLSFISFSLSCPLGFLFLKRPDVLLASSPPIFPMLPTWLICKFRRIPFILEVRDLWPDSAIQMGILKNKKLISIMSWMEGLLYTQSRKIIALTEGIYHNICSRGWDANKLELVTCSVNFNNLYPDLDGSKLIVQKYGWQNKKIILYFGALGEANNTSVILFAAQRFISQPEILFVLIGDGMKRLSIEQKINQLGLKNVLVLPAVPKDTARQYINAATLCLVTLQDIPLFTGTIPTKLVDYLACSKPVLCGIRGEAKDIIQEAQCGLFFEPNDDLQLANGINTLINDNEKMYKMGQSGLNYVREKFSAETMNLKMENVLYEITQS